MGRLRSYLRVHRRRWHLTQEELAFLLGYADQSIIARLEQDERAVTLGVAYTCELLFGVEPREVFPMLFEKIKTSAVERIYDLHGQLLQSSSAPKTLAKLELLQQAIRRLEAARQREV